MTINLNQLQYNNLIYVGKKGKSFFFAGALKTQYESYNTHTDLFYNKVINTINPENL